MKTIILFLLLSLNLVAQDKRHSDNVEKRAVKDFIGVSARLAANIYLKQADTFSVTIEGSSRLLERVETYVKDSMLNIRLDYDHDFFNSFEKVRIYITAPAFERLNFSGAGKAISENTLTGKNLKIRHSGAHHVDLDIDYTEVSAIMSGVGSIYLKGKADSLDLDMSGTGSIDAYDLKVQNADCVVSGLGSIYCHVDNNLKAAVSGLGSVKYRGDPKQVKKRVSGLGKIVER